MRSLRRILRSKSGETLLEGIVSLLVFTLLVGAVTLMLNWSLRETGNSIREGALLQQMADDAVMGEYTENDYDGNLIPASPAPSVVLTVIGTDGTEIEITIPVTATDFSEFVEFHP